MSDKLEHQLKSLRKIRPFAIAHRVEKAMDRNRRGGSVIPDGYPRKSSAEGSPGTPGWVIPSETDPDLGEFVPATPVELAAHALIDAHAGKLPLDEMHKACARLGPAVDRLLEAAFDVTGILEGIDNFTEGPKEEPAWCSSCERIGAAEPRYRGDLCRWCYEIQNDKKANPDRKLPPLTLLDKHHRIGRITTTDIARAFRQEQKAS